MTSMCRTNPVFGFIGAGQMARALARGFSRGPHAPDGGLIIYDPVAAACDEFVREMPASQVAASNAALVEAADVVFLAVKPQHFPQVASELAPQAASEVLFVSILAGVPLAVLCERLQTRRVVRVMPNTPCLVGSGAAGYTLGPDVTAADRELVQQLLDRVGVAIPLDEAQLDAVTGLSGSGPAYVYTMIEALSDGGVRMGLPRSAAARLAAHTVLGAARMVIETDDHPSVLKDRVTSPGGTTIVGLQVLEGHGFRAALIDAVQAATERSRELGQS